MNFVSFRMHGINIVNVTLTSVKVKMLEVKDPLSNKKDLQRQWARGVPGVLDCGFLLIS